MMREEKITLSPGPQCHIGMIAGRDAGQRRARLALAAGAQIEHAGGRQLGGLVFVEVGGKSVR